MRYPARATSRLTQYWGLQDRLFPDERYQQEVWPDGWVGVYLATDVEARRVGSASDPDIRNLIATIRDQRAELATLTRKLQEQHDTVTRLVAERNALQQQLGESSAHANLEKDLLAILIHHCSRHSIDEYPPDPHSSPGAAV